MENNNTNYGQSVTGVVILCFVINRKINGRV